MDIAFLILLENPSLWLMPAGIAAVLTYWVYDPEKVRELYAHKTTWKKVRDFSGIFALFYGIAFVIYGAISLLVHVFT